MTDGAPDHCAWCGASAPDPGAERLAWSSGVEAGRPVLWCPTCSRTHLRAMEAKLDPEHW